MTTEVYRKPGIGAKLSDMAAGASDQARAAWREAMTWSFYQWTVLALLTATFILVALSYGGIRAELAALKSDGAPASVSSALDQRVTEMSATLTQSIADLKAGLEAKLADIGAKLDAKSPAAKPAAPTPKPAPRPRAQ